MLLDFYLEELFGVVQIEGNNANADDAIMLDKNGYVSETNATNIVRECIFCISVSHSFAFAMRWHPPFVSIRSST